MRKWRKDSIFGDGPRVPLDRERRAQFRAKLHLQRRPGRLTIAAAELGRVLADMLGADGRLDPSHETLAARAGMHVATVQRALAQLKAFGFLDWTRRLVRGASTGWRCEQTSNAYVLHVPTCDAHFARAVRSVEKEKRPLNDQEARINAAQQLVLLGFAVPEAWARP